MLAYGNCEHYGVAEVIDGVVDIGGVKVPHDHGDAHVYVQKWINHPDPNRVIANIIISKHDGLAEASSDDS